MDHTWRWCALLCLATGTNAAGGVKLWQLGDDVDANPITVFTMFTFTVMLTIIIETIKHKTEHNTHDVHRKMALGAIYSELMMVGVVSFMLILAAELGLTDIKVRKPGCTPPEDVVTGNSTGSGSVAAGSVAGSGSGSGDPCIIGFNLLMFEYAHLVLFFMGITYGIFIQVSFWQRDRMVRQINEIQMTTLSETCGFSYVVPSLFSIVGIGVCDSSGWARCLLTLRAAMVLQLKDQIKNVCRTEEVLIEETLAIMKGQPPPPMRASPDKALEAFDLSRFAHIAIAEVLVELLHVPPVVWLAIVAMSATNLIHKFGLSLPVTVVIFAFLGPLLAISLLFRMAKQLQEIVKRAVGHPDICSHEYVNAIGSRDPVVVPKNIGHDGQMWAAGEEAPWDTLDGCCDDDSLFNALDPNDPGSLEIQIQIIVFACCFFVGQITMLNSLIYNELGVAAVMLCWGLPIFPLVVLVPRALALYTLTHKTLEPARTWLVEACVVRSAHGHGHGDGHGHGGHGDGHGHGNGHFSEKHLAEQIIKADKSLRELKHHMDKEFYDNTDHTKSEMLSIELTPRRQSTGSASPNTTMTEVNGGNSFVSTSLRSGSVQFTANEREMGMGRQQTLPPPVPSAPSRGMSGRRPPRTYGMLHDTRSMELEEIPTVEQPSPYQHLDNNSPRNSSIGLAKQRYA
eukprot:TRINITY_DN580_c0_g1_i3.p1 TRINITY_DN580_c0_g1~~TRINITY_DN580_c0_g1_i3.p1  ORF type:complete len:681 (+),score=179.97 TRINITY_DN580_c0_g1_i3:34-2076(+)